MTNPTVYPVLDRLNVVYRVTTKVRASHFVATANFVITVGLYAGTPDAATLIENIAARGVTGDDIEADFLQFAFKPGPRELVSLEIIAAEVQEVFQTPDLHSRISLKAEILEVVIDDSQIIAAAIDTAAPAAVTLAGAQLP